MKLVAQSGIVGVLVDEHVFGQNCDIRAATFQKISSGSRISDSGIKVVQSYVHVQSFSGTNATFCPSRWTIKEVPAAS